MSGASTKMWLLLLATILAFCGHVVFAAEAEAHRRQQQLWDQEIGSVYYRTGFAGPTTGPNGESGYFVDPSPYYDDVIRLLESPDPFSCSHCPRRGFGFRYVQTSANSILETQDLPAGMSFSVIKV
jgi:hypothetical protein